MLSAAQLALFEWFQQSRWTAWQEERWLFRQYGVRVIVRLTTEQAIEALQRLQQQAA
jgi:hypothetical protein